MATQSSPSTSLPSIRGVLFYLGLGCLFTHELDAMRHHEWRLLPLTNWLPEHDAETLFIWLHVPLFAGLVALVASRRERTRHRSQVGVSAFLVVHALVHTLALSDARNEFVSTTSYGLIFGGGLLGLSHLALLGLQRQAHLSER